MPDTDTVVATASPALPPELVDDIATLTAVWRTTPLAPWADILPAQAAAGMAASRFGDLPRWRAALAALPPLEATHVDLNSAAITATGTVDAMEQATLRAALMGLHPWRKGPFSLFGVDIDSEWRSDWKWERLSAEARALSGQRVLDVGCGSGYHCWRMRGAGAREVIGIEPTPLFVLQFKAVQRYLRQPGIHVLPATMESLPRPLRSFDTVFSMGVLYHRRSPIDHLLELRDALCKGGLLVLETLVVEGSDTTVLVPRGRYARMGNVWFLPSPEGLVVWLRKLGFGDIRVVDVCDTTSDEQRRTEWMTFQSLADFLDPEDPRRTLEGYPAPRRAVLTARAP